MHSGTDVSYHMIYHACKLAAEARSVNHTAFDYTWLLTADKMKSFVQVHQYL